MTLTEQGNPANTATVTGRRTALGVEVKPAARAAEREIRFRAPASPGQAASTPTTSTTASCARRCGCRATRNRCGEWRKRARQIPVSDPATGIWTVQFDQLKQYREPGQNFPSVYVQLQISVTLVQAERPSRHGGRGLRGPRPLEAQLAVGGVHADAVAGGVVALEEPDRERVDQVLLDDPLERPGAVGRVVAHVAEQRPRGVRQLDRDAALGDAADQRATWRSTIAPSCSRVSDSNSTMSSSRLTNSGLK